MVRPKRIDGSQLPYNRDPVTWRWTAAISPHLRDADYTLSTTLIGFLASEGCD